MNLMIGTTAEGKPFTLPADLGDKKIALVAQSNKGKTYGLGCILEELVKARRPFVAVDPANNLWGLRVLPDGRPSGLQVVVIGGPHGDIPLERDAGERIAEALLASPQAAVIDISSETAGTYRRFMTDFAARLMRTRCDFEMPIFLEEAPVLIPQKAFGPQMEICKAAVAKLATIGGNFGYGVFPASQRPATMDKDVLSQCEALIVMGLTHTPDRKTVAEWIQAKDLGGRVDAMFAELGSLTPGQAWLWWPGEDRFEKFTFRKRETLHPREMKKLGLKRTGVQLGDAQAFVEKLKRELAKTVVSTADLAKVSKEPVAKALERARKAVLEEPGRVRTMNEVLHQEIKLREDAQNHPLLARQLHDQSEEIAKLRAEVEQLSKDRWQEQLRREGAEERLAIARTTLKPQFEMLRRLFEEIGEASPSSAQNAESPVWQQWLEKARKKGAGKALEVLLQRGRLTQQQLATLAGIKITGGHWRRVRAFLTKNNLANLEGESIEIARLTA